MGAIPSAVDASLARLRQLALDVALEDQRGLQHLTTGALLHAQPVVAVIERGALACRLHDAELDHTRSAPLYGSHSALT